MKKEVKKDLSEKDKISEMMKELRARGYATRVSLAPATVEAFLATLQKKGKGLFLLGHDLPDTYDKSGMLQRRVYAVPIGGEMEEVLGVMFDKELNIYWNGRPGWAIEIRPEYEEKKEMYF